MLMDWLHWLQEIRPEELALVLILLLVVDAPRYAWSAVAMACWDIMRAICGTVLRRRRRPPRFSVYRPTVSVLIAGYNEADTIGTMASVRGNYPGLQTVVVDDGSTDDMYGAALGVCHRENGYHCDQATASRRKVIGTESWPVLRHRRNRRLCGCRFSGQHRRH